MQRLTTALSDRYRLEREVAIKVLHPDLGAALGGERFLSEIRTTARLQPLRRGCWRGGVAT